MSQFRLPDCPCRVADWFSGTAFFVHADDCGYKLGTALRVRLESPMQLDTIRVHIILLCLTLVLGCAHAEGSSVWFQRRITWQAGGEPRVWETAIVSPNGKEHYRLALVPLWAVEGGIVGIEILLASPEHPDDNLLGRRDTDAPLPFVVTVEELESGIKKSRFGAKRDFNLKRAKLRVEILGWRLGDGIGDCGSCKNIQEITTSFSFDYK